MSKKTTALVLILGVLLGCAAGMVGTQKACEHHNPQMNLRGTLLDCAR